MLPYYFDSMPRNVVGDPTNPKGTLRPNLCPKLSTRDYYEPLICPVFGPNIALPSSIDQANPLAIWSLFFPQEHLQNIVLNTNKRGHSLCENKRVWTNINISKLYAYLAILFYIGIHIENDTKEY